MLITDLLETVYDLLNAFALMVNSKANVYRQPICSSTKEALANKRWCPFVW